MLRLALSTLRSRATAFVGAFLALVCAAALVTACGTLLETGLRGSVPTERYAGAPIVVGGDQNVHATKHRKGRTKTKSKPLSERVWIPESVADRLRRVPGVRDAVGEVTFPAYPVRDGRTVAGPDGGPSWGHAWDSAVLTPFALRPGRAPTGPDEVVVDAGLARRAGLRVGSEVDVVSTAEPSTYRVVGVAAPAGAGDRGPRRQSALFFAAGEARRLAGHPGSVTAVGVLTEPGSDLAAVRASITDALRGTGARVATGDDRGLVEFLDAGRARVMLVSAGGALGGTSLLVAILVVAGTFALSVNQREREIALLRAVGATPGQVRAMIGREALLLGLAAGVPGAVAGLGVAGWLRARFVDHGVVPDALRLARGPLPMLAAVAAAMAAAWLAARLSARRSARVRPTQALGEAAVGPARPRLGRAVAGAVFLAGAVAATLLLRHLSAEPAASPVTFLTVVLWSAALALLGPVLARAALGVLGPPLRGSAGYLAAANLRTDPRRTAAAVTPLALLVALASTVLFVPSTMAHAAQQETDRGTVADYTLRAAAPGVPASVADAARRLPGVAAVTEVVHTTVRVGLDKYQAQGVTVDGLRHTMDPLVRSGSLDGMATGTAAVSRTAADHLRLGVGGTLRLRLGDGTPASLRVVAVYERGLGFGDLTLPHDLVAAHVDDPLADTVLVAADRARCPSPPAGGGQGGEAGGGACGLRAALAALTRDHPTVRLLDAAGLRAQQAHAQRASAAVNYVAMGLVVAFTVIAAVNTLVMSTAARSREFALLRLVGVTARQVRRMLRVEALLAALLAVAVGGGVALSTLSAFSTGMTGSAVPYVPPLAFGLVAGTAAGLALAATALTARLALRGHPADVVGLGE